MLNRIFILSFSLFLASAYGYAGGANVILAANKLRCIDVLVLIRSSRSYTAAKNIAKRQLPSFSKPDQERILWTFYEHALTFVIFNADQLNYVENLRHQLLYSGKNKEAALGYYISHINLLKQILDDVLFSLEETKFNPVAREEVFKSIDELVEVENYLPEAFTGADRNYFKRIFRAYALQPHFEPSVRTKFAEAYEVFAGKKPEANVDLSKKEVSQLLEKVARLASSLEPTAKVELDKNLKTLESSKRVSNLARSLDGLYIVRNSLDISSATLTNKLWAAQNRILTRLRAISKNERDLSRSVEAQIYLEDVSGEKDLKRICAQLKDAIMAHDLDRVQYSLVEIRKFSEPMIKGEVLLQIKQLFQLFQAHRAEWDAEIKSESDAGISRSGNFKGREGRKKASREASEIKEIEIFFREVATQHLAKLNESVLLMESLPQTKTLQPIVSKNRSILNRAMREMIEVGLIENKPGE